MFTTSKPALVSGQAQASREAAQYGGALPAYTRGQTSGPARSHSEEHLGLPASPLAGQGVAMVYVSTATHWLTSAELSRLLTQARQRNRELGVTGVLLYSYGNFMQYLEGPTDAVAEVYEIIRRSALHKGLIELIHEPIDAREFGDWTMAFRDISAFGMSDPPAIDQTFAGGPSEMPGPASAARRLLMGFWNKGGVRSSF
jgi:hypothetical protein